MKPHKYVFKKYNSVFPKIYESEENRLRKILGHDPIIQHIGSSAVPELGGKGIIDIVIFCPSKKVKPYLNKLIKHNYKYNPNHPGDAMRKIFLRKRIFKGKPYLVHVHLTADPKFYEGYIVLRDYLRRNKKDKERYQEIKKEAVKVANGDGRKYHAHKKLVVDKIFAKAMKK